MNIYMERCICTLFAQIYTVRERPPASDGYRPVYLVTDNYLTTGIHHYYNVEFVSSSGTAKGTITFLSPELYPRCL